MFLSSSSDNSHFARIVFVSTSGLTFRILWSAVIKSPSAVEIAIPSTRFFGFVRHLARVVCESDRWSQNGKCQTHVVSCVCPSFWAQTCSDDTRPPNRQMNKLLIMLLSWGVASNHTQVTVHDSQICTELGGREVFQNTCRIVPDQNTNNRNAYTQTQPSPPHQKYASLWLFTPLRSVHHKKKTVFWNPGPETGDWPLVHGVVGSQPQKIMTSCARIGEYGCVDDVYQLLPPDQTREENPSANIARGSCPERGRDRLAIALP